MSRDYAFEWLKQGRDNGWIMPAAPWWKRLPVIRHLRAAILKSRVEHHNAFWISAGKIPTGYDEWVLFGIWHGM